MKTLKLKEIEFVERKGSGCNQCIFEDIYNCEEFLDLVAKNYSDCACRDGYFRFKKDWFRCNKNNTKAGDTVRCQITGSVFEAKYIFSDGLRFIGMPLGKEDIDKPLVLDDYEIEREYENL